MDRNALEIERLNHRISTSQRITYFSCAGIALTFFAMLLLTTNAAASEDAPTGATHAAAWLATCIMWTLSFLGAIVGTSGWRSAAHRRLRREGDAGFLMYAIGPGVADVFFLVAAVLVSVIGVNLWTLA
ncbi:MAG: hypothetical protein M3Q60_14475 [Actinomycetota bacterium]|nr:hypothetical protein [Actinomycetota bacterium]